MLDNFEKKFENEDKIIKKKFYSKGIELGLEPQRILGCKKNKNGKLYFFLKWDIEENLCELIPNKIMRKMYPLVLLKFYEENICVEDD